MRPDPASYEDNLVNRKLACRLLEKLGRAWRRAWTTIWPSPSKRDELARVLQEAALPPGVAG